MANPKVATQTHISNLASGETLCYTHPRPVCGTTMFAPTRLLLRSSLLGWSDHAKFPNGQLTYVAGEVLTSSAFLPLFGRLLQAQGRYPGETRISFSCKVSINSD
uniref:Uncharacterized protein n=1 Tax=Ananas comosus var. bracteatus TaxID=296719 RepID=A0A6V7PS90_ANACO|nr:unnamed protein product [Ananas comosus var. bracteatus]